MSKDPTPAQIAFTLETIESVFAPGELMKQAQAIWAYCQEVDRDLFKRAAVLALLQKRIEMEVPGGTDARATLMATADVLAGDYSLTLRTS